MPGVRAAAAETTSQVLHHLRHFEIETIGGAQRVPRFFHASRGGKASRMPVVCKSRQARSRRQQLRQLAHCYAHDSRPCTIRDRLDSGTMAKDKRRDQASGVTNIHQLVVGVDSCKRVKVARFQPIRLRAPARSPVQFRPVG